MKTTNIKKDWTRPMREILRMTPKARRALEKEAHASMKRAEQEYTAQKAAEQNKLTWARAMNQASDKWPGTNFDALFEQARTVKTWLDEAKQTSNRDEQDTTLQLARAFISHIGEMALAAILQNRSEWFAGIAEALPVWTAHSPKPKHRELVLLRKGAPGKAHTAYELRMELAEHKLQDMDPSNLTRWGRARGINMGGGHRGRPHKAVPVLKKGKRPKATT